MGGHMNARLNGHIGEHIDIPVADAAAPGIKRIGGWLARPDGQPRGALVVIQEIFGVNAHMREVVDGYARAGYLALAPALFDPIERNVELDYDDAGFQRGRALVDALGVERALALVAASARSLQGLLDQSFANALMSVGDAPRIGVVGFCWGGTIAYLANTRLGLPAVSYYGARSVPYLDETLCAPMMFHFGEHDTSIPAHDIALHRQKQPRAEIHVYPAGHAFNRAVDTRAYAADSATLAHRRTLAFFGQALG